jgi:cellobiose-specific phosphotransferase system component IIC
MGALLAAVNLVLGILIYIPFVIMGERYEARQAAELEKAARQQSDPVQDTVSQTDA